MNTIIIFCAEAFIFIASVYAVIHIYFKHEKKHHVRHILMVIGTAVLTWVIAHLIKDGVAHPRPTGPTLLIPDDSNSFPSGHASYMFALAFTMYHLDKNPGRILFVLAIATGVARVLAGVHYWYDIVAGAALGYIISVVVVTLCKRLIRHA